MRGKKQTKRVYGILFVLFVMVLGIQANAARALNQAFATAAGSVLVDRATIAYTATLPEIPASDDGVLYLFEMQPYEYTVAPTAVPVASAPASLTPAFTVPYTGARLYTKLGLAVKSGGQNVLIANPQYIANPELLATHTRARQARPLKSEQGKDFCNLYMSENANGVIAGRYTTAQIMNNGGNQAITNPYSRAAIIPTDTHPVAPQHYMLNASEPAGIAAIAAELSRVAANSTVENFIVGNEVNVRTWNYMIWTDWDSYIRLAEKMHSELAGELAAHRSLLYQAQQEYNAAIDSLPNRICISDGDMDCKNVLWKNGEPFIIDLECLDYGNPFPEMLQLALSWAGGDVCSIDPGRLHTFLTAYRAEYGEIPVDWKMLSGAGYSWLDWLEYNTKRALRIECGDEEEQRLGLREAQETIRRIDYYQHVREKIFSTG